MTMNELERMSLILEIVSEAKRLLGTISRTHLQKLVYLLQEIKSVPLGYNFKMNYYGPYSRGLWGTLCGMQDLDLIDIKFCPHPFRYIISESGSVELERFLKVASVSGLDENIAKYQESCRSIFQLISQHKQGGIWYLELLSITHFIHKMLALYKQRPPDEEIVSGVKGLKPRFSNEDVKQALMTLREGDFLNGV